jgi:hypothetical protein
VFGRGGGKRKHIYDVVDSRCVEEAYLRTHSRIRRGVPRVQEGNCLFVKIRAQDVHTERTPHG